MPDVTFAKQFKWSPNGIKIKTYEPGKRSVSARCAECAKEAGVLKKAPAKSKGKATTPPPPPSGSESTETGKSSPTANKAAAGPPENKTS